MTDLAYDEQLMLCSPARIDGELAALENRIATLMLEVRNLRKRVEARNEEFTARGGWTRGFLVVTNGHGHLHKSRDCTTCYATTRYSWMTEVSGKSEDELVALAGERACTICYPTAPVDVLRRPTQLFTPEEIEAKRVRDEQKSQREAKKADKGITAPDGSVLRVASDSGRGTTDRIDTLYTARYEAVQAVYWSDGTLKGHYEARFNALVDAIAHKLGQDRNVVFDDLFKKGMKKLRKG